MNQLDRFESASLAAIEMVVQGRQHVGPKHLHEPGPNRDVLERLFHNAAAAPDHEQMRPWRFVVFGTQARAELAQVFASALMERDASAGAQQLEEARAKAYRSPALVLAIADLGTPNPSVADAEKLVSLGCAIQNLLLCAQALGYATGLTSGKALASAVFRRSYGLTEGEQAVCFINIGTPAKPRPKKPRPQPQDFVRWL